jgi:hypothetical protein
LGRPHFQSKKVCLSKPIFNILFITFELKKKQQKDFLQPCAGSLVYTLTLEMMNGCCVKTFQEPSVHLCALCLFEFVGTF